jgi:hypothetical protein
MAARPERFLPKRLGSDCTLTHSIHFSFMTVATISVTVSARLAHATILVEIPLPPNVRLADDPTARSVTLRRGIPTTLNTPP